MFIETYRTLQALSHRRLRIVPITIVFAALFYVLVSRHLFLPKRTSTYDANPHLPARSRLGRLLYNSPESGTEDRLVPWRSRTRTALRDLFICLEKDNCAPNQEKVILVENMYFRNTLRGEVGGEEIWAASTTHAMQNLGYTILYAESLRETANFYRMLPNLVKLVLVNDWDAFVCWKDNQNCVQSDKNPSGIPMYKVFSFYFWAFPRHPLGQRWVLAPEPFADHPDRYVKSNNTFLGYSIEEDCALTPFIPPAGRPSQVWVLAKLLRYLNPKRGAAWGKDDLDAAANHTGVTLAFGAGLGQGESKKDLPALEGLLPSASVNYGRAPKAEFMAHVAQARALVGIGSPLMSPTPWNALCMGVPFINPVNQWDGWHKDDRSKYFSQHLIMSYLDPPYVYNVRKDDREGFVNAIQQALNNPIESYVPEWMRMSSVEKRLADIVDHDWEAEAKTLAEWCNEPCGCMKPCDMRDHP
ncbi:hypothetical protein C8R43DRAFT_1212095 [Mycena crocata]|nr:hypothetical protein C8R43DRAFT_1212095 [Mycena crocata]